ncbi:OmpA family protein [Pelagibaculum spongiae]|uniref:Cell envelope biogenesis protein OmpA n=1 Tax=Pelagibaculum spongiae TaxID=2080658 RepID=A0A2V1GPG6_9GAMM|nr:OmpA family protein [Pelagibaculum spongiae]PVZ64479.1 cell envelope biogenesis protein OmpA [Pelagibaculum spongiae]
MNKLLLTGADEQEENHWLSVSDLMAGLMMVFLFISIALMRNAFIERDKIKQIAIAYQENQVAIYDALTSEFKEDLSQWDAGIDENTLTFTFNAPEVLFETGQIDLSPTYQALLDEFFPRYMEVLKPFQSSINEVRIEGHTSSDWNIGSSEEEAYFKNMKLSQGRTRAVLDYVYRLPSSAPFRQWIKFHLAAVGLSSSKPVLSLQGNEDKVRSRRVSFRVITNSDIQIKRILEEA